MTDLKATVTALAHASGFDLVGITSADDFVTDRNAALKRIQDGQMDGLPWYTESRVMRGHQSVRVAARRTIGNLPWPELLEPGRA